MVALEAKFNWLSIGMLVCLLALTISSHCNAECFSYHVMSCHVMPYHTRAILHGYHASLVQSSISRCIPFSLYHRLHFSKAMQRRAAPCNAMSLCHDYLVRVYSSPPPPGAPCLPICLAFNNSSHNNKLLAIPCELAIQFLRTR